ncbi:MAG TPA: crotonase/enoyl-CoA hydratase family protein [Xanthomonadaceae bacterium]|nr:crotonase/enoyl-CoA hydratase family protein [Xanthomonadaceae bacterium]
MPPVELLLPRHTYATLRVDEQPEAAIYWMSMHADLQRHPGRACFRTELIDDILDYQRLLARRLEVESGNAPGGLAHVVLASCDDSFNLGGDLALFAEAIRRRDRPALFDYASRCVRGVHAFHDGLAGRAHTIALVQGDALGGGFEAALSCHTIVAEEGVGMGLPEVLFDLFPGMGAYSFLCERVSPRVAERLMLEGRVYSAEELHKLGLVDVLAPKGEGVRAVHEVIRNNRRIPHACRAMHQVARSANQCSLDALMRITEIWVDTAMQLGDKPLRTMERLVKAQERRGKSRWEANPAFAPAS